MKRIVHSLSLALAAGMLLSVAPAPQQPYSSGLLALLDPTTMARGLCGGRERASGSMRAMLSTAAALVPSDPDARTPLYDDMGKVHFPITTASPVAQRYFDQGLAMAYGFNHAGAIASFREAQRLDPGCAMCFWGEALAHGPNINAPMDPATNARAVGLARYAEWLARKATPAEQVLTAAMMKRYSADPNVDRAALDAAYADAMLAAATAEPANDDIALLAAEAAMDTRPWDYWLPDGRTPQPRLGEAVGLVEAVFARNPDHPQAAHLYIHLMENGPDPKRAEAAADWLATPLAPQAAHLVHMPAHIYYRVGRWKDSIRVNIAAARADEEWIRASGDRGLVRYGYYPHNVHFIVTSAQMAGDMATAIREAGRLEQMLDPSTSAKIAWVQAIHAAPYFAAAQFATPRQILAMRAPDARLPYASAMRHYARALAYAQQRNRAGFDQEMTKLRALRLGDGVQPMIDQGVPVRDLIQLAETVARARWAYANGRFGDAEKLFREAILIEDKLPYMEPPYWYYPVHQSLGSVLYRQRRYDEALTAFTAALTRSPNNGWALYGVASAQRALGRAAHAAAAEAALQKAWAGDPNWLRMDRL
ncbi:tetratricopeptide repeat protein [Sphingobium chungbukense]|uniref:Tetratricopeptide repeat protein n=1 Tax=Sphingobium chungbukense TaxID=56193 RepID=A0A0M3ASW3_9SPHN|nr:tetratricopeptide repeat protein [Sphingobium chungbukense]KKW91619.1 tetratricopeptide repeat protein [Sphingobium chungbukense]